MQPDLYSEKLSVQGTIKSAPQPGGGRNLFLSKKALIFPRIGGLFSGQKDQYLGMYGGHFIFTLKHPPRMTSLLDMRCSIPSISWTSQTSGLKEKKGGGFRIYVPKRIMPLLPFSPLGPLREDLVIFFGLHLDSDRKPQHCEIQHANFIAGCLK